MHHSVTRALRQCLIVFFALVSPWASADEQAVDYEKGILVLALSSEPPQLDSTKSTDQVSGMVLGHVMEGLLRYDARGRLVPGVAKSYELSAKRALFRLREDARWSDGRTVTAHDFVFAWRRVLDPATASEYSFILYPIRNAEKINKGELPVDRLAARALDDFTLEVELERPTAFFDKLVAFSTYYPVNEEFYATRADRYGGNAEDLLYNGSFRITTWDHGSRLSADKNEFYWDRDNVKLNRINWAYITADTSSRLNFFKDGRIALTPLDDQTMLVALQRKWRIKKFNDGAIFYLDYNFRPGRPTTNYHLRRAMQLVFDPHEFANKVIGVPGTLPGKSLFPVWLQGVDLRLRQENPAPEPEYDLDRARKHLELAKEQLGVARIPGLSLLVGDAPTSRKQAEYFQNLFKTRLGLDIRIDAQIFKQRLAKMTAGEFDMVGAGWGPDFDDPLTFGDLYATWNLNNRGRYSNAELDAAIRRVQNSTDPAERVRIFGWIQQHMYDRAVFLPNYERSLIYVQHPQLRGVVRRVVGPDPDFTRAWLAPPPPRG